MLGFVSLQVFLDFERGFAAHLAVIDWAPAVLSVTENVWEPTSAAVKV